MIKVWQLQSTEKENITVVNRKLLLIFQKQDMNKNVTTRKKLCEDFGTLQ